MYLMTMAYLINQIAVALGVLGTIMILSGGLAI